MSVDAATVPPVQDRSAAVEHLACAAVALVVGGGLAVLAHLSAAALVAGVAGTQALLIASWVLGTGLPGRIGGLVIGALAAAAADVVIVHWPDGQLAPLLAVFGLALPAMFIHQLTRGVVRLRVTESLSDIALLVICVVALPAFVQLRHETGGTAMTTTVIGAVAAALVTGHLVDARWAVPRFDAAVPRGLIGVAAGTAVAGVFGYLRLHDTVEFSSGRSLFLGAAVGAVVSLLAVGVGFLPRKAVIGWLRAVYVVLIPLALVAPVAYLLGLAVRA